MTRVLPTSTHQPSRISKFLTPYDDDDQLLDAIQTSSTSFRPLDEYSDSEPELNTDYSNEYDCIIDKNNITFGVTTRGGRELHMCGYSYQIKGENETTTRWRCVFRSPSCPVTIHTNSVDHTFSYWNGAFHNHAPDETRGLIKCVIAKIKARVLVEPYPVVLIAEEEIRKANMNKTQLAAMPLPYKIESALQKHRRKNIPPLPLSFDFDIPLLYQRTWSGDEFIVADIKKKRVGGRLIMFSSSEQVDLLLSSTTWVCDGTFKTRPLLFAQAYIIQCLVGDEVLPVVYVLTANRKRKTYEHRIKRIR